jgi:transcriptional regulator with XRE-family HTH domain
MEDEGLSLRTAGEQAGIAHTTIARVMNDESVDFSTVDTICRWLGVPVPAALEVRQDGMEILEQIAAVLAINPELSDVFSEIADKVIAGEISREILAEVAAFASYRLKTHKEESNERSDQDVLLENRADTFSE